MVMTLDPRTVLGFSMALAFIGVLFVLIFRPIELSDVQAGLLNVLLGALTGQLVQVYNFYFGSSSGSKDKDDALIAATEKKS
jgi:drug/metabolite transporter (DMT)-like permease